MGAVFSKPKAPEPPPPPPPQEIKPPKITDKEVTTARESVSKRARAALGRDDTIKTSPLGLPSRFAQGRQTLLGRAGY